MRPRQQISVKPLGKRPFLVIVALIAGVLGVLYIVASILLYIAVPLAAAFGLGYGLSALTRIPLPTAIGLALGAIVVGAIVYFGRRVLGALTAIYELLDADDDDDDD